MQLVPQTRKLISLGFAWSPVLLMRWVVQHRAYVLNNDVLYALIAFSNVATLVMSQLKLQPSVCMAEWI